MIYIILILVIAIILKVLQEYLYYIKKEEKKEYKFNGITKDSPLTNNEKLFYNKLKNITNKYNINIFPKLRLADIFETKNFEDFNKIKSKHIDFTLCNNELKFIMFIELDDNTHEKVKNKANDNKKNKIFESCNIEIIRIKNNEINEKLVEIEKKISTLI